MSLISALVACSAAALAIGFYRQSKSSSGCIIDEQMLDAAGLSMVVGGLVSLVAVGLISLIGLRHARGAYLRWVSRG